MSYDQIKSTVRQVYEEIFNAGDLEITREVIAPWAVDHAPSSLSSLPVYALEEFLVELCTAFPDIY
jgi:hypothetical protein